LTLGDAHSTLSLLQLYGENNMDEFLSDDLADLGVGDLLDELAVPVEDADLSDEG
jgi:hypothetical protein